MHITFLIGNGFDRNLGLKTTYSDFVKVYKNLKSEVPYIREFREHIKDNEEKWSAAEEALGQYTQQLEAGQGGVFSACQSDFCFHLADYLKKQQERIDYDANQAKIKKAFGRFQSLFASFPAGVRAKIGAIYENRTAENIYFDFINFNYTYTLDKCVTIIKQNPGILGSHEYGGRKFVHTVGKLCHVHGTVDGEMVFGVNDESQIAKPEVFNGCDLSKKFLIKRFTNESQEENTDSKVHDILKASQFIYVYGMALGITDKLWWGRICRWLEEGQSRHLVIHQYGMPPKGAFQFIYQQYAQNKRQEFMRLGEVSKDKWAMIENRIHITGENIFSEIENIANPFEIVNKTAASDKSNLATVG